MKIDICFRSSMPVVRARSNDEARCRNGAALRIAKKMTVPQSDDGEAGPMISAPSIKRGTSGDYVVGIDASLARL
ncbi:hypothetical protein CCGE531_31740 (plasmid) [Rhizobium sp. CCGE531]|nr:hypothetical protein CCGE531_31740 [Rhizobium sp. CCGE531]PST61676.1 hypothetical protein C9E91_17150 [Rhizobium sp. SEMIA4064]TGE87603.1 hypothetical protein C9417_31475 [Rhizobium sp. SEMIA 4088]